MVHRFVRLLFILMIYFFAEIEDEILRTWIERFIETYNKNVQSSTEPTHIQRIAKKSRTNTSSKPVPEYRNIAPMTMYPFFFNPYYHQTIHYPHYVPLPYGTPARLIPMSQVPYSQEESHHRFLVPPHAQIPTVTDHPKIKKPINVQTNAPPNNQDEIPQYEKPQEIPTIDASNKILNPHPDGIIHGGQPSIEHRLESHPIDNDNKYEANPTRGGKLLTNTDNLPDSIPTMIPYYPFNESQSIENLTQLTTGDAFLDTSTLIDTISNPETGHTTSTSIPMTISDISDPLDVISSSVPQLPFDSNYQWSDALRTILRSFPPTTDQPVTTIETESITTSNNIPVAMSTVEENKNSGEPQENQQYSRSLNNKEPTTDISEMFYIKPEDKLTEIINETKTPNIEIASLSSDITFYPRNALFSARLSKNNDSQTSKSPLINSPSIIPTLSNDSYYSPNQMRSVGSTTQSTQDYNTSNNQSDLIITSTNSSPISTMVLEITSFPFTAAQSSTILPSSSPPPNKMNSHQTSSYSIMGYVKNTQSTNVYYTSLLPTFKSLNDTVSKIEDKTEKYSSIVDKSSMKTTTENTNILTSNDKLVTSTPATPTIIPLPRVNKPKPLIKTTQTNLPEDIKMESKYNTGTNAGTEKSINTYKIENTNNYFRPATERTRETPQISVKSNSSTRRMFPDDSKHRKISDSPDQYTSMTETPQSYKDSDLWYNHMNTQSLRKNELNEEQKDFLLKKLIKLLKPENDKQLITKDSLAGAIAPKLGDQKKLVYIIVPWGRDPVRTVDYEDQREINTGT